MDLKLTGKVVLITGSSRGLGKAIAETFLTEGARIVVSGRSRDDVERTANEFSKRFDPHQLVAFTGDLTLSDQTLKCVEGVLNAFGRIDILVANIGSGKGSVEWNVSDEEWSNSMALNLDGARRITNAVVPNMLENSSGSVVYIASIAGREIIGAPVEYSVAKAALIALSKNIARRLARNNIRVNAVCPGNILFEGGSWDNKLKQDREKVLAMLESSVPMKRFATPAEIADLVAFIASDRASFLTGSCIVVDGGQTAST